MASKLHTDDVSLVVVLLDVNPFFWGGALKKTTTTNSPSVLSFSNFLNHVLPFLNSILLLNQLNQVVVIACGANTCGYIYDSSETKTSEAGVGGSGRMPDLCERVLGSLEEFVGNDQRTGWGADPTAANAASGMLSGSLSLALCCIHFRNNVFLFAVLRFSSLVFVWFDWFLLLLFD